MEITFIRTYNMKILHNVERFNILSTVISVEKATLMRLILITYIGSRIMYSVTNVILVFTLHR